MGNTPLAAHNADWVAARALVDEHGLIKEIKLPSDEDYCFTLIYWDDHEVTISIPGGEDDEGLGW